MALIGRVADPVRPYLIARKTGLSLSSQIAVYIVERLFDAGSMALIFSIAMIWVPGDQVLNATAHSGPLPASSHTIRISRFLLRDTEAFASRFLARSSWSRCA